jgi:peptide/nickel transport system substrate-binding protein
MNRAASRTLATGAAALLAAVFVGCGSAERATGDTGGTMIVVVPAEPASLFPPAESSTQGLAVITQLFDRLAEIGMELNTVGDRDFTPRLASGWTWAADSLSIAFTIDSAARWHDGAPVTAEDVGYSFRTYTSDVVLSDLRSLLGNIDSVSVDGTHTAVFWFKRRTPQQFFDATYHMFILPSHLLAPLADSALISSEYARRPVGTGRFRFERWDAGARIEIVADTLNPRGRAKLDRVIFSRAADAGAATVRLFAGEADFYEQVRPENFGQVARSPQLKLVANPSLTYNFLGFNLRDPASASRPHPVFGNPAVRRALLLATDRDRLVRSIFDTLGTSSIGPAPRALFPDTTLFTRPAFSLSAARALLDSAGWTAPGGDGVRSRNGVRLAFEILSPGSSLPRQRAATQLQEQYRAVGADVTPSTLAPELLGPRMMSGKFDAWMGGWQATPGLRGLPGVWGSGGRQNFQRYANRQFDVAMEAALTRFDEAGSRAALGRAFQAIWDDPPSVWLFEPQNPIAMHRRIQHTPIRADGWFNGLADWSIDPAQRIDRDRVGLREGTRR